METLPYNDFGNWIRKKFPFRVQKISVDAGFTCPNRDGRFSVNGCTFCDNRTFSPSYCSRSKSIKEQIEEGKAFFARKYPEMKYLAYFQSFTNTYGSLEDLKRKYEEALAVDDVVGIVIGTRPDCVDEQKLDYIAKLNEECFVIVEYGIESSNNETLRRINRSHTFECSKEAIKKTKERGIITGGHIIIGLPGEDQNESLRQAPIISESGLDILKIHQMQIIKGTKLAKEYTENPFHLYSVDEYIELISKYIQHLNKDLILERFVSQSPKNMLLAPKWDMKNYEFTNRLINVMKSKGAYQGKLVNNVN